MPTVTIQYYITDTLTAIDGASVAVWNSNDTAVVESGVSDANGQFQKTLSDGTYTVRTFKDGYTFGDSTFTLSGVDKTITVYGDLVPYGAKTYSYYKNRVIANLNGRNDQSTLSRIMSAFNDTLEYVSRLKVEDLFTSKQTSLTASKNSYTFSELGLDDLFEVEGIRLYDGSQWLLPMSYSPPNLWDASYAMYDDSGDKPYVYTRKGKTLRFYPTPDSGYTIELNCYVYASPVTGDASTVDVPNMDSILVNLTTASVLMSLGQTDLANNYIAKAEYLLSLIRQRDLFNRYTNSNVISGTVANMP